MLGGIIADVQLHTFATAKVLLFFDIRKDLYNFIQKKQSEDCLLIESAVFLLVFV